MPAPTTTRKNIRQKAIKRLYRGHYPIVSTNTGAGTTTTLVDSELGPNGVVEDFLRSWIYVPVAPADNSPVAGFTARVTNFTPSTNTLTFTPATTGDGTDETGMEYELHYKWHPRRIHDAIDFIMENLRAPIAVPLSLIGDGDMEYTGTISDYWAATSATVTKSTTAGFVLRGRQSLKVASSGAGGQARSNTLAITPGTNVIVATDVFIDSISGQANIVLKNASTGATIDSATSTARGWVTLFFNVGIPSGCEQVYIDLQNPVNGTDVYFNSCILLPTDLAFINFPTSLEFHEDFSKVSELPLGPSSGVSGDDGAYRVDAMLPVPFRDYDILRDDTAANPYRIKLGQTITAPLYVSGKRDFALLTDDATTTTAPEDIVVDLVWAHMLEAWADELDEHERFTGAAAKRAQAVQIRQRLRPRMIAFSENSAKVYGANS